MNEENGKMVVTSLEERKARVLMEIRGYQQTAQSEVKGGVEFLVKTPRREETVLMWCISEQAGVDFVRRMLKKMDSAGVKAGIIVVRQITHAAKALAREKGLELIPRDFPSFNIFKHKLVPLHEILTGKVREQMLRKYHIEPYQLPSISMSDPAVIAIGARPGDIIKILRHSSTAGQHVYYRYVMEEAGQPPRPKEVYARIDSSMEDGDES